MEIRGEIRVDAPRENAFEFVRTPEVLAAVFGSNVRSAIEEREHVAGAA